MSISNSLTKTDNKKSTFSVYMASDAVKNKINQMMSGKDGGKFITSLVSLVANNPAIAKCEHSTILASALLGESLKLSASPQLGQYYIVPFNDTKNNRTVAQFQLGYKGYIQLAIRSGYYKKLNVLAIKEGELINYNPLDETLEVKLIEDETVREQTPTIGYYAMFEYQNGFVKTLYWSKAKMEAHAQKYSQAYRSDLQKGNKYSFWSKDFDGMAFKTMLRQLISKWGIMSVDFQTALQNDMAVIEENGQAQYVDNSGEFIEAEPLVEHQPEEPQEQPENANNDDPFNNFE